jgi:cobalt-zinc-cadmium efflux system protein
VALGLIVGLMVGEVVVGMIVGSLALLSDAAHMLTDAGALALGIVAMRLAARPPQGGFTYGLKRAEILSALASGVTLAVLGVLIVGEAVHRLVNPLDVGGRAVLIVALAGIAVNVAATWQLAGANRCSLNMEGSFQHVVTDLYAFIGTAIAGIVILTTGFHRADAIASLFIAALMARAAWGLIGQAGRALMEASPGGMRPDEIGNALASHAHVANVHDLHVWEITSGFPALSAHVIVHPGDDCHAIRLELEQFLVERFGIEHTTLQVDHESDGRVRWTEKPMPTTRRRN